MPAQNTEIISISPEGGGRVEDIRRLLLKRKVFLPEVCKYLIGNRQDPPSYKAFLEWVQKREIDADE